MNLAVTGYYGLRHKSNYQIQAKLWLLYGKVAVCRRTVNKWAICFRSGKISIEDHSFGLFDPRRVCFHRGTFEKQSKRERFNSAFLTLTILRNAIGSMSTLRSKIRTKATGCTSNCWISQKCSVTSEKWRGTVHQSALSARFPWFGTMWLLLIQIFEEKMRMQERQVRKPGDLCGGTNVQATIIKWFW
jgi:hypothetical protein